METKILNYKIIIEKENNFFVAYCPTLGLSDYGKTIDQVIKKIRNLIKFHIESLSKLNYPIPVEKDSTALITNVEVSITSKNKFSYL